MIRLAARIPRPLRHHALLWTALLVLVVLAPPRAPWREETPLTEHPGVAFAPPPAATAGMLERMQ